MKEKLKHLPLVLPLVSFGYAIVVILDNKENLYRFCHFPFPFIMCPVCEYPCFFKNYQLLILSGTTITGLIAGRLFCGGVCPAGSIQNWLTSLKRRLFSLANRDPKKFAPKSSWKAVLDEAWKTPDKCLRFLKYPFLLLVILYSLNRFAMFLRFMPAWGIIPGAELALAVRGMAGPGFINFWLLILITVFIIGLFIHRPWCKYLCPIGLLFAVFNKISLLKIRLGKKSVRKGEECLKNCTTGQPFNKLEKGFASVECVRCYDCVLNCPEGDVKLKAGIRR